MRRKVWIDGPGGDYVVRGKMNRRWESRIDMFMGEHVGGARQWGKRKVTIYYQTQKPPD